MLCHQAHTINKPKKIKLWTAFTCLKTTSPDKKKCLKKEPKESTQSNLAILSKDLLSVKI